MELRQCRYFLAVIDAGTITRAAAELGISQPSLSQQIRLLEDQLGTKLFDRGRKTQLTAAGKVLVPHARLLLDAAANAEREVAGSRSLAGGKLSIAFIPSLERLVSSAIAELSQRFPDVVVNLREQMGRSIDRLLLAGEIDLGLAVRRHSPPEISAAVLYREPYVLAFRRGHELEHTKLKRLNMIGDTPFAVFSFGSYSRDTTDSYLSRLKFLPNIRLESESLENLLNIVASTDMCAILPRNPVSRRADLNFHDLSTPLPTRSVAVITHSRRNASPAAREFIKLIRKCAKAENA